MSQGPLDLRLREQRVWAGGVVRGWVGVVHDVADCRQLHAYPGTALAFRWAAVAREPRRGFDQLHETDLGVSP